ncbi:hypothetical protein JCM10449v2_006809 [Rhodotorula kratochvilovae]
MSPLAHRHQAPRTPPKTRSRVTRTAVSTARSLPAAAAPKSHHARIDSSSPVPAAVDPASVGAPVKDSHSERYDHPTAGEEDDARPESPIESRARDRRSARADRKALNRSEGGDGASSSGNDDTARRSTFSKVVSSSRSSLAGLGERAPTPAITPIASSPYVPPHLRQHLQSTAGKENNPLSRFDRSACPEPEDSFYSHLSRAFSVGSPSPLSTPNTSFVYSPATSSARAKAEAKGLHLASPASSTPFAFFAPGIGSAPPSPTTLLSRQPYLDPLHHPHPTPIPEEECDDDVAPPASARSWADEVDEAFPLADGDAGALSPGEEALLGFEGYDGAESASSAGFDVQIGVSFRRGSAYTALSSPLGVPEDEVADGVCTGCGAAKTDCFVVLSPCGHFLCPVCVNALINATAHKPPRPTTCFACAAPIVSFVPAVSSGTGIVDALLASFERGQVERRLSLSEAAALPLDGRSTADARRRRRRSSVVAAAIATVLSTPSSSAKERSTPQGGSPAETLTGGKDGADGSPLARRSRRRSDSLTSSPVQPLRFHGRDTSGSSVGGGDAPSSTPDLLRYTHRSTESDVFTAPSGAASTTGTTPLFASRASVDWPVVRLDNVPWEVTVDEIEAWLPSGCLARDSGAGAGAQEGGEEGPRGGEGEGVTLAVHVLCNRADGRTLNQAYVECSSRAAARKIVRLRDGVRLRSRPVHITIASQGELLGTVFPTYRPGFDGLAPLPSARTRGSPPIPLLVQTELTGLLNQCRLESAHAKKVPERPFFNIVTLLEKMPWAYPKCYNSTGIVRLFNTACAAIEILGTVKHTVSGWQDILTVLVDAVLRCPVLRPTQRQKAVRLAASIGFERYAASPNGRIALMPVSGPSTVSGVLDAFALPFAPASLHEAYVSTAHNPAHAPTAPLGEGDAARFEDISDASSASASTGSIATDASKKRQRRRSSLAAELGIAPGVLDSVAKALGYALVGSTRADAEEAEEGQ